MSTLVHTLQLVQKVKFNDHTGISFKNVTTGELVSNVTSTTVSIANIIKYSVTWVTDPIKDDVIHILYDNTIGNYSDLNNVPMPQQDIEIRNCLS